MGFLGGPKLPYAELAMVRLGMSVMSTTQSRGCIFGTAGMLCSAQSLAWVVLS